MLNSNQLFIKIASQHTAEIVTHNQHTIIEWLAKNELEREEKPPMRTLIHVNVSTLNSWAK